jgi:integrase
VIRIITETGLRVYKELAAMSKNQVDIPNKVVFIADSKTPTRVAEVPLNEIAVEAFRSQIELAGPGPWLFPSSKKPGEAQSNFKMTWERSLRKGVSPTPAL